MQPVRSPYRTRITKVNAALRSLIHIYITHATRYMRYISVVILSVACGSRCLWKFFPLIRSGILELGDWIMEFCTAELRAQCAERSLE